MKNMILALTLFLNFGLVCGALADGLPIEKQVQVTNLPDQRILPAYISIKTMAEPTIHYSTDNDRLSIVVSGGAKEKDESKLEKLLTSSVKIHADGGVEVKVKESGLYHCSSEIENGFLVGVSGLCITDIKINFAKGQVVPLYVNGRLQQLN